MKKNGLLTISDLDIGAFDFFPTKFSQTNWAKQITKERNTFHKCDASFISTYMEGHINQMFFFKGALFPKSPFHSMRTLQEVRTF